MVSAMELWGVIGSQVAGMAELTGQVRRWEEVGVAGVFATDHLFFDMEGSRRTARRQPDPYILLAAAGAVTERAKLGTIVANAGLQHPALLLRHFSQLARLFGGERVYAGLGAGWNREEFEAVRPPRRTTPRKKAEVRSMTFIDRPTRAPWRLPRP